MCFSATQSYDGLPAAGPVAGPVVVLRDLPISGGRTGSTSARRASSAHFAGNLGGRRKTGWHAWSISFA
jgi:hypothetical protein